MFIFKFLMIRISNNENSFYQQLIIHQGAEKILTDLYSLDIRNRRVLLISYAFHQNEAPAID